MQQGRPAHALEPPLFEGAKDLGLQRERQLPDLVEKQGAAVRELEFPRFAIRCPGERALLVAKELRFQKVLGDCRAVDGDKWAVGPLAQRVERTGKQLLASAAFSLEQHRGVGSSRPLQGDRHLLQSRVLADDLRGTTLCREFVFQQDVFRGEPPLRQRALHHEQQHVGVDGLGEKIQGTLFHRRDGILDAAESRHHDDRHFRIEIFGGS